MAEQMSVGAIAFARAARALSWGGFFTLVVAGWVGFMAMAAVERLPEGTEVLGIDYWRSLCTVGASSGTFGVVYGMWALMSAAMMAPTIVPALRTYLDLVHAGAGGVGGFWGLVGGYASVWLVFSAVAALAQTWLSGAGLVRPDGVLVLPGLSALLLFGAGLYQFAPLKAACLSQCRAPLVFFLGNWRDGVAGAALMGLRLGLVCLGCCWALMLLAFVGGTMNLVFMGLATVLMVIEKLPDVGRLVTRPLGIALLFGAAFEVALAAGFLQVFP